MISLRSTVEWKEDLSADYCMYVCLDKIKGADRDMYKVPVEGFAGHMYNGLPASREEDKRKMKSVYFFYMNMYFLKVYFRECPDNPVVKTLHFHYQGLGFDP